MKTKTLIFWICVYIIAVVIFGIAAIYKQINAEPILSEQGKINRYFTEEVVKTEIRYLASVDCINSMTDDEYADTFLKD